MLLLLLNYPWRRVWRLPAPSDARPDGGRTPRTLPGCVAEARSAPTPLPDAACTAAGKGEPGFRAGGERTYSPSLAVGGALATERSVPGRPCRG